MLKRTILLLFCSVTATAQQDSVAVRFSKTIKTTELKEYLSVLASDEYEGRETGEKGQKMAAEYIANKFKFFGIPPYKENAYYQEYPLNLLYPSPTEVYVKGKKYTANVDYFLMPGQAEQTIDVNTFTFLGYGINDSLYNDYANVNVKDRALIVLDGEPYTKDSVSLITGKKQPSLWTLYSRNKSFEANKAGAKVLFVILEDRKSVV